jgi:hypothetical protein
MRKDVFALLDHFDPLGSAIGHEHSSNALLQIKVLRITNGIFFFFHTLMLHRLPRY